MVNHFIQPQAGKVIYLKNRKFVWPSTESIIANET